MERQEEEGTRKRQATECDYDIVQKKLRTPARGNEVDEKNEQEVMAWLTLHDDDETVITELSELLDLSSAQQLNFKVKFIEDPYNTTPVICQSSSAYVTINGNEESCGSSFSDSDSTVMASVDTGSFRGALSRELNVDGGGAWSSDAAEEVEGGSGWMEGSNYVEGIFVKSLSGCCDLFGSPPPSPPFGYNYENGDGDGDCEGDGEIWVNFLDADLFGGTW